MSRSSYLYFIELPNAGGWLSEGIAFLQVGQILEELTAARELLTVLCIAEQKVLPGRWWLLHLCNMFTRRLWGHYWTIFPASSVLSIDLKMHPVKIHSRVRAIHFWVNYLCIPGPQVCFLSTGLYVFLPSIFNMVMLSDPHVFCWLVVIIKWIKTHFEHTQVVNGEVLCQCHMPMLAIFSFLKNWFIGQGI